jgi:hypothetical protein
VSLINEALKRTRDAAYEPAQTSPPAATEYRLEIEPKARGSKAVFMVLGVIGAAVLAGVVVLAVWVVPRVQGVKDGLSPDKELPAAEAKSPVPTAHPVSAIEVDSTVTPRPPVPAPSSDSRGTEDQIVAKVMERIKAEQPAGPQLILQGITYASDNRDAMINGVTVHEGEVIEGARVAMIENHRVTLTFNGHDIILRLP